MPTNSKAAKLLFTLDRYEKSRFEKFLISPWCNENVSLLFLYKALMPAGNSQDSPTIKFTRQSLFSEIFPKKAYDDLQLRHLLAEFLKTLQHFLAFERYRKNPGREDLDLLATLRERAQNKAYEFRLSQAYESLGEKSGKTQNYLLSRFLLEAEHGKYLEHKKARKQRSNLADEVRYLDLFYLLNKLKIACNILNNQNIVDFDYEMPLLNEISAHLAKNTYPEAPEIEVYYKIFTALSTPGTEQHFENLMATLSQYVSEFHPDEARDMYAFAQNYCIIKINQGNNEYLAHIFSIYKIVLEREIILERENISPWDFKNIVVTGLRLGHYDWVEIFIKKYKDRIPLSFRQNAYTYNLARLHFFRKAYGPTLKLLQQVAFDDVFYNLDSKVMLLKIYYEMNEPGALDSLIDSFRIFLRRNKLISEQHRTNYLNLIKYVRKMSRIRPGDSRRIKKLKQDIPTTAQIADINWLKEQVEMLE